MQTDKHSTNRPADSARNKVLLLLAGCALVLVTVALLLRNTLWGDPRELAERLDERAAEHLSKGDFERAEELWRESLEWWSKLPGPEAPQMALILQNRGHALLALDRLDSAMGSYQRSIELCTRADGDRRLLADGLSARAGINLSLDLYHRAEPDYREAIRLGRTLPDERPDRIGLDWLHLAECMEGQKHFEAADSACDSSLALLGQTDTETSRNYAEAVLAKGRTQIRLNRAALAEAYVREAVSLCDRLYAPADPEPHLARGCLGWCLLVQGHFDEAEPLLLKSYARLSTLPGTDPRLVRETAGHLAELYDRSGKPDLAAHYQSQARPPGETGSAE